MEKPRKLKPTEIKISKDLPEKTRMQIKRYLYFVECLNEEKGI